MIIEQEFYYPPAGQNRTLHIRLPEEYDRETERYPVMYFFDGHNLFFDERATYGRSWRLGSFLDQWPKKIIIVGMECSHEGYDRLAEYCPYRKRMFGHIIDGIGEATMQWIIRDIKPYIDANFRTWGHREATGIGGSSMGGLMSLYAGIRHNAVFSKAACVSPGVFHNLSSLRRDLQESSLSPDTKLFLSWGETEAGKAAHNGNPEYDTREARGIRKFEKELQEKNAQTYLFFQRNGRHCEEDWEKQIPVFMPYLWL